MSDERKELLYIFDELVTNATKFIPAKLQKERDEAYEQIRNLIIQQKPEIDEKYVKEMAWKLFEVELLCIENIKKIVTQIIKDAQGRKKSKVAE